ncbi:MAG: oligosaccharide flippase family protein [Deltaproteobacteria bacterium]|nr:oligosaccharide flippase family protein [Deltaproteobacteria bacterium]
MSNSPLSLWRRLWDSSFAKDSALLVLSQAAVGFLFLLTHVILGREMDGGTYAIVVALLGLLNILSLPTNTVQVVVTRYIAGIESPHHQLGAQVVRTISRRVLGWGSAGLLAWAAFAWWQSSAGAPQLVPGAGRGALSLVGFLAFLGLFSPIFHGALTGEQKFGWLVGSSLSGALLRALFALLVVALWATVEGALTAIAASSLVALGVAWWPFRKAALETGGKPPWSAKEILHYAGPVLIGQGALYVLLNADLILAPRYFAGTDLAAYSKGAMLSRAILFLPLPIATAMFPRAVTSARARILLAPLAFAAVSSLAAATMVSLFPQLPLKLMYGVSGTAYQEVARTYVWAAAPLTLTVLASHYLWARHRPGAVLWLVPVVAGYVGYLTLLQPSPTELAVTLGGVATLSFAVLGWQLLRAGKGSEGSPTPELPVVSTRE